MNRQQRRAAGGDLRCVDCGSAQARLKADDGRICVPCHDARSRELHAMSDAGTIVVQPIDLDEPPIECVIPGCRRDGVTVFVILRHIIPACAEHLHVDVAYNVALRVQEGAA